MAHPRYDDKKRNGNDTYLQNSCHSQDLKHLLELQ